MVQAVLHPASDSDNLTGPAGWRNNPTEALTCAGCPMRADANKQRSITGQDWRRDRDPARSSRAVREYLATRRRPTLYRRAVGVQSQANPYGPNWAGSLKAPRRGVHAPSRHIAKAVALDAPSALGCQMLLDVTDLVPCQIFGDFSNDARLDIAMKGPA
jgi:hypothetical protein